MNDDPRISAVERTMSEWETFTAGDGHRSIRMRDRPPTGEEVLAAADAVDSLRVGDIRDRLAALGVLEAVDAMVVALRLGANEWAADEGNAALKLAHAAGLTEGSA